jgi:hypothetical protein
MGSISAASRHSDGTPTDAIRASPDRERKAKDMKIVVIGGTGLIGSQVV